MKLQTIAMAVSVVFADAACQSAAVSPVAPTSATSEPRSLFGSDTTESPFGMMSIGSAPATTEDACDPTPPVRVGGNIPPPRLIREVPPVYPPEARAARVQGIVILEITVGPCGNVVDARVLRSIPLLDRAAVDAVRQWQYEPPRLPNNVPAP